MPHAVHFFVGSKEQNPDPAVHREHWYIVQESRRYCRVVCMCGVTADVFCLGSISWKCDREEESNQFPLFFFFFFLCAVIIKELLLFSLCVHVRRKWGAEWSHRLRMISRM